MKLEYVYNNNSNLKHTLKALSIFELSIILIFSLMLVYIDKNIDNSFPSIFMFRTISIFIFWDIVFLIFMTLTNNYKRKQFISIKDKGKYCEAIIIMANYQFEFYRRSSKWLWKDLGEITVSVENKIYKITDIDYNNEFKLLEQKINDNFKQYINLKQQIENTGILGNVYRKKITVGIYILDNKAVADLDSVKAN